MDYYNNSQANDAPVLQDLSQYPRPNISSNYASVYQVKYNTELIFVYVQYQNQYPSFDELIGAVKQQCQIGDDYTIEISNEKNCKIQNDVVFAHFIRYVYNGDSVFIVTTQKSEATSAPEVISPLEQTDLPRIYENPDKFFIFFLAKDLIAYFKHQTQIICSPNGSQLIEKYNVLKNPNLEEPHKKSIIQIAANHLMLIKNNEPSTQDRALWAKVICEVFVQFRDTGSGSNDNYLAVYNPVKGDGFLGNRIKLLKKAEKRARTNKAIIEELNSNPSASEQTEQASEPFDVHQSDIQQLVDYMKTCDVVKELATIKDYHKKTFPFRQHLRQSKEFAKLISDFPRFFDVDGLIDEEFAQLYPLSGLITFTQEVQQKILKTARDSKNYAKFPTSHKNLAEPINALLHLILLLPPTSLGRGSKNRVKIEDAFPRLVQLHEINQPLLDLVKSREGTPFIVVSGSSESCYKLYYVVYDGNIITCESATRAIDILLKVHYVFDITFDSNVRHVLGFIGYYFYHIRNLEPTSQMRLLNTQLLN